MANTRPKKRALNTPSKRALHYKVVELSSVDEASLERTLNEWSPLGWVFDGVQFAMRESSKRPSMAFVFFTKEGGPLPDAVEPSEAHRPPKQARAHLQRLAGTKPVTDSWSRLQAMAVDDETGDV